jgi:hypothetical protein
VGASAVQRRVDAVAQPEVASDCDITETGRQGTQRGGGTIAVEWLRSMRRRSTWRV